MHCSILISFHVMAEKTGIAIILCTMILGRHILIKFIAVPINFLLILRKAHAGNALWCELLHYLAEKRHRSLCNQIGDQRMVSEYVTHLCEFMVSEKRMAPVILLHS